MFKVFANAFKVKDIRKKIFYVLMILAIYRLGCHIPVAGMDLANWEALNSSMRNGQLTIQALVGGGRGTLFALGVGPYITASIVMQLLTVAIPKLEQMQKEGQDGREKINNITRYVAVGLALLNAASEVFGLTHHQTIYGAVNMFGETATFFTYAVAAVSMASGTMLVMWMSELLTERGFGNGGSFIIFANILSGLPAQFMNLLMNLAPIPSDIIKGILTFVVFLAVIAFAILIQDGERRIPVQYSKKMVGRQLTGGQASFIPLKVNIAGVMSIIFAMTLLQLPEIINGFLNNETLTTIIGYLKHTHPVGAILYIVLIFAFTFFYTSFAVNPNEMAENIKKNGGAIPGIRPGKATSDYIERTVYRLSWIGAAFYALIAMAPVLFEVILKVPAGFGGTTLLIVSSVALEIVKQLESLLLMRHYKGFLE